MPVGGAACFALDECARAVAAAAGSFLHHWRGHDFAWTETTFMHKLLMPAQPGSHQSMGVLPLLLLFLHATGHGLLGLERRGAP